MVEHRSRTPKLSVSEKLLAQAAYFQAQPELAGFLDAMPMLLIVINDERQIIFGNRQLKEWAHLKDIRSILGLSPGELLDCIHLADPGTFCGSTQACKVCGGNEAIKACQEGLSTVQECRLTQWHSGKAMDLRISSTPIRVHKDAFYIIVLADISHEKRRQTLERIFFHDLMNLSSSIVTYASVLNRLSDSPDAIQAAASIQQLVFQLSDEIRAQRELAEAESDELKVQWESVSSQQMLETVFNHYRQPGTVQERTLQLDPATADVTFLTDRALLGRVLGNMVKNAIEASKPGDTITACCLADAATVEFRVHNPGCIPPAIQLQIFHRSFSTKGRGHGLGTYSIQLLTERYLNGHAWFTTSPEVGTTFHVRYPRSNGPTANTDGMYHP
ncbi:MAG: HAMP domain-containing histidine kinase [Phycisphaerae bacterium]|nr:HAMP domain-containing histidine kinase [Phycisphaerae bacterium]